MSTKTCSRAKSCYRLCSGRQRNCPAHEAKYIATLEYKENKTSVAITLGGYLPTNDVSNFTYSAIVSFTYH